MPAQVLLHHAERAVAFFHPVLERVLLQLAAALDQGEPEVRRPDVGLDRVLLEEHPLQRLGAVEAVLRPQRRAAGEVPEDRVRFRDIAAGRDLEQRNLTARVLGQELGRVTLALEDIDLFESIWITQVGEREPHLVTIARSLHRIEGIHRRPSSASLMQPYAFLAAAALRIPCCGCATRHGQCHDTTEREYAASQHWHSALSL